MLLMLLPGISPAVLPRFRHPQTAQPPFTLLTFSANTQPATIYQNNPASIQAARTGPEMPDRADVVFLNGDRPADTQPMLRDDDGKYILQIDRVEHSQDFYIDTPRGRSQRYTLSVTPTPLESLSPDLDHRLQQLHEEQHRLQKELAELKQKLVAMALPDDATRRRIAQDERAMAKYDDAAAQLAAALHERGAQKQSPQGSPLAGLPSSHAGSPSSASFSGQTPHPSVSNQAQAPSNALEKGVGPGAGQDQSRDAPMNRNDSTETLTPPADANRGAAGIGLQGVPAPYREQAQAYFERLAQDSNDRKIK